MTKRDDVGVPEDDKTFVGSTLGRSLGSVNDKETDLVERGSVDV